MASWAWRAFSKGKLLAMMLRMVPSDAAFTIRPISSKEPM